MPCLSDSRKGHPVWDTVNMGLLLRPQNKAAIDHMDLSRSAETKQSGHVATGKPRFPIIVTPFLIITEPLQDHVEPSLSGVQKRLRSMVQEWR
ncbi:hypothetical protein EVAR_13866_1 [Eumeta japonica]|uniref:Uncharacterized protein n=1 Tax=Eumeta variegata TaxID=151549 RepID=A0A4C1U211_EUMVA|nr:hypothetical protein EVAR_13866_1 [Eumeta japonica]